MKGDIKPRAQTIQTDLQTHRPSTCPRGFSNIGAALLGPLRTFTPYWKIHPSELMKKGKIIADTESPKPFSLSLPPKPPYPFPFPIPASYIAAPLSLTSSPFKNTPAYTNFYLVSTSIPNPIYPFPPELGKSPNALVSGCFLNTCSISYLSHLRINEPTTRCNESPSRTSASPPPSPFPKPLPPLPPPYSSQNPTANRTPPSLRSKHKTKILQPQL